MNHNSSNIKINLKPTQNSVININGYKLLELFQGLFVYTLSAMILSSSCAPAPQLAALIGAGAALPAIDALVGAGAVGGALLTPAGLIIGGAGAASIPTSVLLLKKAALVKGALVAGLLASQSN